MILKVQKNIYEKETFNVVNTSIARTAGWRKLTFVLQGVQLVPLWFNGKQFPDELIKPEKTKVNIVCNEETPLPPLPPQAWRPTRFSVPVEKYTLQDSIKSDDDFFAGNEGDKFDTDTSDSDSGGSNDEAYISPRKVWRIKVVTWYGLL